VQIGDNVIIGGFIIAGDYPAKVLIRAARLSLPVEGSLQDPTLYLVDSQGNTISNEARVGQQQRRNHQQRRLARDAGGGDHRHNGAATNDREAAIVAALVPGAYTAIVRGKDDSVGVALVEGYTLP
jgi:hypothetical protein